MIKLETKKEKMEKKFYIFTDGGARGNPGPAAVGFLVKNEKREKIYQEGKYIGRATNNVAEYRAVLAALEWLAENKQKLGTDLNLTFFLDSNLVVNQLNGLFKIKNTNLRNLIIQVRQLEKGLAQRIIYRHVMRKKNREADKLVNQALDQLQK